jgi:hypothetical protein
MIGAKEVRFLSSQYHLFKSEQEQEKQKRCKSLDNTMHILGGHRQERPRVGPLGWGSAPPKLDKDDPTTMATTTLLVGEDDET